ncbi:MAG TPA: glycosyltransferase family 9 protein [Cytophagaceae bacterium]|jgi:ADP-heptose:LPS heptosyltransferase|nr:glycosyltransferase family 9 protein [Cytophagaceae bacterium]
MKLQFKRRIDFLLGNFLVVINLIIAKSLGFIMQRNHSIEKKPSTIIFIKMLGLGSIFLASNAILAVKKKYPEAKLILLTGSGIKPGLSSIGLFDEIWEIRDKNFFMLLADSFSIFITIWKRRRVWVADLEVYSKLTTVFALWTCARNRFGFILNTVRFRINMNTHNIYFNQFVNVEENYIRLAEAMGASVAENFYLDKYLPEGRRAEITYPYLAVNNTCSDLSLERKCPDPLLAEVCRWILQNTPYHLAFTGAPSDKDKINCFITDSFNEKERIRIKNSAGIFSFEEYYDFLYHQCAAMLTIDSAPLHIAKKLSIPTLSLWGPTNPINLSKTDNRNFVYYLSKECSPCVHHTETLPCKGDNTCMKHMSKENITKQLQKLLENIR